MEEILEQCRILNQLIMDSKEYKNYTYALGSIKTNEELYNSLMEFKKRYTDVMHYTEGNPYDEIYRLTNDYDDLLHNSTVNEFLRAESAFSKLVRGVIGEISDGFSVEI